ncbi:MAG: hypothetical protein HFG41_05665 [Coprococcus sp.]|nr:hypothetical protein [Coprococcus sp.]
MKGTNPEFNNFVGEWIRTYRSRQEYTIDMMSEKLLVDSRSYADQEKGKLGFSGHTLSRFLIQLPEPEVLNFVRGLKKIVWWEEFKDVE